MTPFEYRRLTNSQDEQQLGAILSQCFGNSLTESQHYFNRLGRENFRIICQGGKVIGGLAIYWMGQWYGGKCVPMAGIAAVGVAPEYRGTGAAYALMKHTLQEIHRSGGAISTLYAATQVLYRKVGYEQGGTRSIWELPTATIQLKERQPMQRIPLDYEFSTIYRQQAQAHNGNLERNSAIWQQVVSAKDDPVYADLLGTFDQPEGYVIFTQRQESGVATMIIKDWVLLTPRAIRRFWTFLADHRSQIERVWWQSSSLDPLVLLLREQTAKMIRQERWLLRIINVPLALEKRCYTTIDAQLHLHVHDELIPANNGKFCLTVIQRQGKVTPGGKGELRLDVRGLASLYTGLFTPQQLHYPSTTTAHGLLRSYSRGVVNGDTAIFQYCPLDARFLLDQKSALRVRGARKTAYTFWRRVARKCTPSELVPAVETDPLVPEGRKRSTPERVRVSLASRKPTGSSRAS